MEKSSTTFREPPMSQPGGSLLSVACLPEAAQAWFERAGDIAQNVDA